MTAMLCSEAGDERVSEQGRAVRARARAASPAAPVFPFRGAARAPMQMVRSGRGGEMGPTPQAERELAKGLPTRSAEERTHLPNGRLEC